MCVMKKKEEMNGISVMKEVMKEMKESSNNEKKRNERRKWNENERK